MPHKLGSSKSATLQGWKVNYGLRGAFVTLGYVSAYQQGSADEQFA